MSETPPELERMIATFEAALAGRPNHTRGLIGLAEAVAAKGDRQRAFELCRKALALEPHDPEVAVRVRWVLSRLAPRYQLPLVNDTQRNGAWRGALERAIGPSTHVLEIGTGFGTLALAAARAGAAQVTTCERDPVLAALARDVIAHNGAATRIDVIAKPSTALRLGVDLAEPADLLICDIFADDLLEFDPLTALAHARAHLTTPSAQVIPAAGSIWLALADWRGYARQASVPTADFDLTPSTAFAPPKIALPRDGSELVLRSAPAEAFGFDFSDAFQPTERKTTLGLAAADAGVVNGIVHWIRLQLDERTVLETSPAGGTGFFGNPYFWPLSAPVTLAGGDMLPVTAMHDRQRLFIWSARLETTARAVSNLPESARSLGNRSDSNT